MPLTHNEYRINNTTDFPQHFENRTVAEYDVLVSYDGSSLFTEVPLDETFDYILDEIYVNKKCPQLGSKVLFRRLLNHATLPEKQCFQFQ